MRVERLGWGSIVGFPFATAPEEDFAIWQHVNVDWDVGPFEHWPPFAFDMVLAAGQRRGQARKGAEQKAKAELWQRFRLHGRWLG